MPTIPLTLIEGAIAMPRLRPLHDVPLSFGCDWTLVPPAHARRPELNTLYAAALHTFCLTDQAILSLCRWVPLDARRAAAGLATSATPAAPAPTPAHSTVDTPLRDNDARLAADRVVRSTTIRAPVNGASTEGRMRSGVMAGGACLIGGVAVLAWIALSHPEHRKPNADLKASANVAMVSRSPEPAKRPVAETAAVEAMHIVDADTKVRSTTLAAFDDKAIVASASAVVEASAPVAASSDKAVARHSNINTLREKPATQRATTHHRAARNIARNQQPRIAATRRHKSPSAAADYSLSAPAESAIDEYASMSMSATTHLGDISPSPRIAAPDSSHEPGGTDWKGRTSHRRVTDAPEQFSK